MGNEYLFDIICYLLRLCNYEQFFLKYYAKYLCSKTFLHPNVIRSSVETIIKYNKALSKTYSSGYNKFIEIGPGKLSIPAISIKASLLKHNFVYYGMDKDVNILNDITLFLNNLSLKYYIINDSYYNILSYDLNKSIICLEHVLEDIIIDTLHSQYGNFPAIAVQDIKEILCRSNYSFQKDILIDLLGNIFSRLNLACNNGRNLIIIHHYVSPDSIPNSYLWLLDKMIIEWVDKVTRDKGKEYIKIDFLPSFMDEIFWVGGF